MKISISFPTIRRWWLPNTFRALGAQTFPKSEFEVTMIDDWGDRSSEVESLAKKHELNIKYMQSKPYFWKSNRQLGNARNTGFIHADGELVVFLDDYSWVEPEFLKMHWRLYKKYKSAVIGVVQAVKHKEVVHNSSDLEKEENMDERYKHIQPKQILYPCQPGWFWTFNASCPFEKILEVNGYDERFDCAGEDDVDLGLRMSRVGLKFVFSASPKIMVYHMRHNGGQSRPSPFKSEECHKFTKEMLRVKYDGSWGLLEDNARRKPWMVNLGIFSLAQARNNRDKYSLKEFMYGR